MLFKAERIDYLELVRAEREIKPHECQQCYISSIDNDMLMFAIHFDEDGAFMGRRPHVGALPADFEEVEDHLVYPLGISSEGQPASKPDVEASKIDAK